MLLSCLFDVPVVSDQVRWNADWRPISPRVSCLPPTVLAWPRSPAAALSWSNKPVRLAHITSTDLYSSTYLSPSSCRDLSLSFPFDSSILHVLPSISYLQDLLRPSSHTQLIPQGHLPPYLSNRIKVLDWTTQVSRSPRPKSLSSSTSIIPNDLESGQDTCSELASYSSNVLDSDLFTFSLQKELSS